MSWRRLRTTTSIGGLILGSLPFALAFQRRAPLSITRDVGARTSSSGRWLLDQRSARRLLRRRRDLSSSSSSSSSEHGGHRHHFDESVLGEVGLKDKLSFWKDLPRRRPVSTEDVFCNRELKLGNLRAVGFDMDYTIVQYKQPAFDRLAFDGAVDKLVNVLGYPKELADLDYDHKFWTRGLIIDTRRGNFLKTDRHKYVHVAYHGLTKIPSDARKLLYARAFNKVPSFSEKHFVTMDTLFQHVDADLFGKLVDMKDKGDHAFLDEKTYEEIYREIRQCVDLCHRDGVIKDEVARDPSKYIELDPNIKPMLERFRKDGVKVFLLTNSYWTYTSDAMNYIYHEALVDEQTRSKNEWIDLFDLVVVGSCKPAYLIDPYLNLYRVRPEDGSLLNTDGIYEIEALGEDGAKKFLSEGRVFQGGNWMHLQALLETKAGEEILYVGDHLYSDVLRSKRTLGWRTALIVPELEDEMIVFHETRDDARRIRELRRLRDAINSHADGLRRRAAPLPPSDRDHLDGLERDDESVKEVLSEITDAYHRRFHPVWGQLFYAGYQDSRFAFYVHNYACVYTSKASNFFGLSTERSLRTTGELLPHDRFLVDASFEFDDGGVNDDLSV